jgi:transcriptional regulator with XRE-family HTH domain/quercetin dioxygenase-like cupin family protein
VSDEPLEPPAPPAGAVPGFDPSRIGSAVRDHRDAAGLSARELADAAGVSPSLISQIERNRTSPSVATLYALARALDVSFDALLGTADRDREAEADAEPEPVVWPVPGPAAEFPGRRGTAGSVRRAGERPSLSVATGVRWERLTADDDDHVELLEMTYEVGGSSYGENALVSYRGREYLVVIEGRLAVEVDGERRDLGPGDAFVFDAASPHRLWALGDTRARVITALIGSRS